MGFYERVKKEHLFVFLLILSALIIFNSFGDQFGYTGLVTQTSGDTVTGYGVIDDVTSYFKNIFSRESVGTRQSDGRGRDNGAGVGGVVIINANPTEIKIGETSTLTITTGIKPYSWRLLNPVSLSGCLIEEGTNGGTILDNADSIVVRAVQLGSCNVNVRDAAGKNGAKVISISGIAPGGDTSVDVEGEEEIVSSGREFLSDGQICDRNEQCISGLCEPVNDIIKVCKSGQRVEQPFDQARKIIFSPNLFAQPTSNSVLLTWSSADTENAFVTAAVVETDKLTGNVAAFDSVIGFFKNLFGGVVGIAKESPVYDIWRSTDGVNFDIIDKVSRCAASGQCRYTDTRVQADSTYYYRIGARFDDQETGQAVFTNVATARIPPAGKKANYQSCNENTECASEQCVRQTGGKICYPKEEDLSCEEFNANNCPLTRCEKYGEGCRDKQAKKENGKICSVDSDCQSNYCKPGSPSFCDIRQVLAPTQPCSRHVTENDCIRDYMYCEWDSVKNICVNNGEATVVTPTKLANNFRCNQDSDCQSDYCSAGTPRLCQDRSIPIEACATKYTSVNQAGIGNARIACNADNNCEWKNNICTERAPTPGPTGCTRFTSNEICARNNCEWKNNLCTEKTTLISELTVSAQSTMSVGGIVTATISGGKPTYRVGPLPDSKAICKITSPVPNAEGTSFLLGTTFTVEGLTTGTCRIIVIDNDSPAKSKDVSIIVSPAACSTFSAAQCPADRCQIEGNGCKDKSAPAPQTCAATSLTNCVDNTNCYVTSSNTCADKKNNEEVCLANNQCKSGNCATISATEKKCKPIGFVITTENTSPVVVIKSPLPRDALLKENLEPRYPINRIVAFDAAGSNDKETVATSLTYSWSVRDSSGRIITSFTDATKDYTFTSKGSYTIQLVVSDGRLTSTKSVTIEIYNPGENAPVAEITSGIQNGRVNKGTTITFDSRNSRDTGGTEGGRIISKNWEIKRIGTAQAIRSSNDITVSHTFDTVGDYSVKLTVRDNDNNQHSTETSFKIEDVNVGAPVVSIDTPNSPKVGDMLSFAGVAESSLELISYSWEIDGVAVMGASGTCSSSTYCQNVLRKSDLVKGEHRITYKIKDNRNQEGSAIVTVVVSDVNAPTVSIIKPLGNSNIKQVEYVEGTSVQFEASANDPDGGVVTYSWTDMNGAVLASTATFSISTLSRGTHRITITVNDEEGNSKLDYVDVTIREPDGPMAKIISPKDKSSYKKGETVSFKGERVSGNIVEWLWIDRWGITNPVINPLGTTAEFTKNDLGVGSHEIELIVKDSGDVHSVGRYNIEISVDPSVAPAITIISPESDKNYATNDISFRGQFTDNGNIVNIEWSIDGIGVIGTTQEFNYRLPRGVYTLNVKAIDNENYHSTKSITFAVQSDIVSPTKESEYANGCTNGVDDDGDKVIDKLDKDCTGNYVNLVKISPIDTQVLVGSDIDFTCKAVIGPIEFVDTESKYLNNALDNCVIGKIGDTICSTKSKITGGILFERCDVGNEVFRNKVVSCSVNSNCNAPPTAALGNTSLTALLNVTEVDVCDEGEQGSGLDIRTFKLNDDEFKIGEDIEIEVDVKALSDDRDVKVEVFLYDMSDDDRVVEDEKIITIDRGDTEELTFLLKVPSGADEDNRHKVYVKVSEDGEEDEQCKFKSESVDIEDDSSCKTDRDKDGSCSNVDCDDNNARIYPTATEICTDGLDNDCNGAIDSNDNACAVGSCTSGQTRSCGVNIGQCKSGNEECVNSQWSGVCVGETKATLELCDDANDNDCDGLIDCADSSCTGNSKCGGIGEITDTDFDGLEDEWELEFFGSLNAGSDEDPDNDGKTNIEEFRDGTDPTVPNKKFPWMIVIFVLLGLLLVGLAVYYLYFSKPKSTKLGFGSFSSKSHETYSTTSDSHRKLVDYVKNSLRKGFTKNQIRAALKTKGWTDEEISSAFDKAK